MDTHKISVIMGIYNSEKTLSEAIDSILNQTYDNWQLIMCDDGSTDATFSLAESYRQRYPDRILLLKNDINRKLAFTLNRCLSYADGYYIARMDADDYCSSERFEKQVEFLDNNPDVDLCGTAAWLVPIRGEIKRMLVPPTEPDRYSLHYTVPFIHPSIMARRDVYDALGGYTDTPRTVRCEDCDFWYRFFAAGFKGYNLNEPLFYHREDKAAIMRRTAKGRWNSFRTDIFGYRLLGYPWYWYSRTVIPLLKIFVPRRFILWIKIARAKIHKRV